MKIRWWHYPLLFVCFSSFIGAFLIGWFVFFVFFGRAQAGTFHEYILIPFAILQLDKLIPLAVLSLSGYTFSKLFPSRKAFYTVAVPSLVVGLVMYEKVVFGFLFKQQLGLYDVELLLAIILLPMPGFFALGPLLVESIKGIKR